LGASGKNKAGHQTAPALQTYFVHNELNGVNVRRRVLAGGEPAGGGCAVGLTFMAQMLTTSSPRMAGMDFDCPKYPEPASPVARHATTGRQAKLHGLNGANRIKRQTTPAAVLIVGICNKTPVYLLRREIGKYQRPIKNDVLKLTPPFSPFVQRSAYIYMNINELQRCA